MRREGKHPSQPNSHAGFDEILPRFCGGRAGRLGETQAELE
jgi:hypothetical protein